MTPGLAWLIAIVLLLGYEGWAVVNRTPGDTLSEAVWHAIRERPFVPFLAGFLCGHFFWQSEL